MTRFSSPREEWASGPIAPCSMVTIPLRERSGRTDTAASFPARYLTFCTFVTPGCAQGCALALAVRTTVVFGVNHASEMIGPFPARRIWLHLEVDIA